MPSTEEARFTDVPDTALLVVVDVVARDVVPVATRSPLSTKVPDVISAGVVVMVSVVMTCPLRMMPPVVVIIGSIPPVLPVSSFA